MIINSSSMAPTLGSYLIRDGSESHAVLQKNKCNPGSRRNCPTWNLIFFAEIKKIFFYNEITWSR